MPRLKNLKLGWNTRGDTRFEDTGFYPDHVVDEIAEGFGIQGADANWSLKQRLETAGTMYLAWKHNSSGPMPRDLRAYFQAVIERSRDLVELIEKVDDRSRQLIWQTEQRLQMDAFHKGDTKLADVGVLRWGNESDPEGTIAVYSDLAETLNHLKYVELLGTDCLNQIELGKPGRTRNDALYWWVYEMASFWEKATGERFTVSYHHNEPTSKAGGFLKACLIPMDPEAVGELVGQMRQVLKDRKKRLKKE